MKPWRWAESNLGPNESLRTRSQPSGSLHRGHDETMARELGAKELELRATNIPPPKKKWGRDVVVVFLGRGSFCLDAIRFAQLGIGG